MVLDVSVKTDHLTLPAVSPQSAGSMGLGAGSPTITSRYALGSLSTSGLPDQVHVLRVI